MTLENIVSGSLSVQCCRLYTLQSESKVLASQKELCLKKLHHFWLLRSNTPHTESIMHGRILPLDSFLPLIAISCHFTGTYSHDLLFVDQCCAVYMIVSLIACSISLTQCYGQFQQCSSNASTFWTAAHLPNNLQFVHVQTAAAAFNI